MADPTFGLYRKKPVVIEALQWSGLNYASIIAFTGGTAKAMVAGSNPQKLIIPTLEGIMEAMPGDWIIHGVKGEFYPCKPDIFEMTYERVEVPVNDGSTTPHEGES